MNATANDEAALIQFAADLEAIDWNPDYTPNAKCRAGHRLAKLGWIVVHSLPCRSNSGLMRGTYHAATYAMTEAGRREIVCLKEKARV